MTDGKPMDRYFRNNRSLWDGWAKINYGSDFYDLDGFKSGRTSLRPAEIEEVGDVAGKTLLHLQCHFGLDTLSWARRGAKVTGVDFSEEAVSRARALSDELNIEAEFICSNVYDLPRVLDRQFDIVFTSYGVLCWLPDLDRWAKIVTRYLRPGGMFYMIEFHPLIQTLDDEGKCFERPYFHSPEPLKDERQGSYAAPADSSHTAYEWTHSLGDIVTALISAGLRLELLHEFPFTPYNCWPFLEESEPGKYVLKGRPNTVPLTFSIRGKR